MNVYIYQAELFCEECGLDIKALLNEQGKYPQNPDDETTFDSDFYPKGPYDDGGGESDCVEHCGSGDGCINAIEWDDGSKSGCMLENPLTRDGVEHLKEAIRERNEGEPNEVVDLWESFYKEYLR